MANHKIKLVFCLFQVSRYHSSIYLQTGNPSQTCQDSQSLTQNSTWLPSQQITGILF